MTTLKFGDKNSDVQTLQKHLKSLGYNLKDDGDFGNNTKTAIQNFQKLYSLSITGEATEDVQTIINQEIQRNSKVDSGSYEKIMGLHPMIRYEILHLIKKCIDSNVNIRVVQGYRTFAEQEALYAQGRSKPGPIVTNARGGWSNHNYGLACYSEDTEILTKEGFKKFYDLKPTDEVATFKDEVGKFEIPKHFISYHYSGEMIYIKTRSVDQLITPNHKMVVKHKKNNIWSESWNFIEASQINNKYKIPTGFKEWVKLPVDSPSLYTFSKRAKYSYQDIEVLEEQHYPFSNLMEPETWWEFMGWFLSEGHVAGSNTFEQKGHNNRFKVSIYQSEKSSVRQKLKECLDKTGFHYNENKFGFHIHSKELWSILFKLGNSHTKYIERYLLESDEYLLKKLFIALIDGDGAYYKTHFAYYTASKKLADTFIELCLRLGYSCSIRERKYKKGKKMPHGRFLLNDTLCYEINTHNRITQELRNGNGKSLVTKSNYSGMVYCVTTEAGAIVVKRNGKISIGGNCDFCLLLPNGKISWDLTVDLDKDGIKDWMEVVNIFKNAGYDWGGDWKFKDNPHLEKTFGLSIRQMLKKHDDGQVDREGYILI